MTDFYENDYFINREFKNDFFIFLFGRNKEFALSLYNAMNNSSYDDPDEIIFNTIDNFIYIGRHNDVSFLIENTLNVYEHQTTANANIALRMLLYVAKLYEKYAYQNKAVLYSQDIIRLPSPNFIVFYFGKEEQTDDRLIYLSDAMSIKNSNLELRVRVINVNYGHNQYILNKCPALYEYSWFLAEIRVRYNSIENMEADNIEKMKLAVDEALKTMPESFVIRDIILDHKAEVADMLYSMEDEPRQIRLLIEEHERKARAEAEVEARTKAKDKFLEATISHFMEKGYSKEDAEKEAKEIFEKF